MTALAVLEAGELARMMDEDGNEGADEEDEEQKERRRRRGQRSGRFGTTAERKKCPVRNWSLSFSAVVENGQHDRLNMTVVVTANPKNTPYLPRPALIERCVMLDA
jgi:hypothetical protein